MAALLATYRVQLNAGFRLADLCELVPYLDRLGVSHLYLSPILQSRSGSEHGYDVVDPTRLDSELGDEHDLDRLHAELRRRDMGIVLDIVPNHMATSEENPFWQDVLANGRSSRYADWFDIEWGPEETARPRRILLPVLGDRLLRVLRRGELRLAYSGGFKIRYHEQSFPIDPGTVPYVLSFSKAPRGRAAPDERSDELDDIASRLTQLPGRSAVSPEAAARRHAESAGALRRLNELYETSPVVRERIAGAIAQFRPEAGGYRRLRRLLAGQAYRLAYWRRASREINYRRFFTISHLVALRMEDPTVFSGVHERVLEWVEQGVLDGLRVDHIDGLLDPQDYLDRLNDAVRGRLPGSDSGFPILVEKILGRDEPLPTEWPVTGTTGYEFLADVEDLFIDPQGLRAIEADYRSFTRRRSEYHEVVKAAKRSVLKGHLMAEVRRLARTLHTIASTEASFPELEVGHLESAVIESLANLSIYRTYLDTRRMGHRESDRKVLSHALAGAGLSGLANEAALEVLEAALLLDGPPSGTDDRRRRQRFVQRFQQVAVSAAAKGVEDTAFYVYVPFVARNEVGAEPDAPVAGASDALHSANALRASRRPRSMLAVSTHDTKRSADVRSRIDVLSEMPGEWRKRVRRWHRWNRRHRTRLGWRFAPDRTTEYLLYQTLLGIWPYPESGPGSEDEPLTAEGLSASLIDRVDGYMLKAVREAKVHTSWVNPNSQFEDALRRFVQAVLSDNESDRFLTDLDAFASELTRAGFWNSLSRTIIQFTAPGTPDIYQGDELWNLSLVDPDNRRPVDFQRRSVLLEDALDQPDAGSASSQHLSEILARPEDGRIKLHVIYRVLRVRRACPRLFGSGSYEPLRVSGLHSEHLFSFARLHGDDVAVTVAPRLSYSLSGGVPPIGAIWGDTLLHLPKQPTAKHWRNALTGEKLQARMMGGTPHLRAAEVLAELPVSLLIAES